jgi:hypothetical protein
LNTHSIHTKYTHTQFPPRFLHLTSRFNEIKAQYSASNDFHARVALVLEAQGQIEAANIIRREVLGQVVADGTNSHSGSAHDPNRKMDRAERRQYQKDLQKQQKRELKQGLKERKNVAKLNASSSNDDANASAGSGIANTSTNEVNQLWATVNAYANEVFIKEMEEIQCRDPETARQMIEEFNNNKNNSTHNNSTNKSNKPNKSSNNSNNSTNSTNNGNATAPGNSAPDLYRVLQPSEIPHLKDILIIRLCVGLPLWSCKKVGQALSWMGVFGGDPVGGEHTVNPVNDSLNHINDNDINATHTNAAGGLGGVHTTSAGGVSGMDPEDVDPEDELDLIRSRKRESSSNNSNNSDTGAVGASGTPAGASALIRKVSPSRWDCTDELD